MVTRDEIINYLLETGYPDYAVVLSEMQVAWFDFPGLSAMISKDGTVITLSPGLIKTVKKADRNAVISILVRHELNHRLLKHTARLRHFRSHRIKNIAADLELSHFYSEADILLWNAYSKVFSGGYSVYSHCFGLKTGTFQDRSIFPEFYGKTAEEIYKLFVEHLREEYAHLPAEFKKSRNDRTSCDVNDMSDVGGDISNEEFDDLVEGVLLGDIDEFADTQHLEADDLPIPSSVLAKVRSMVKERTKEIYSTAAQPTHEQRALENRNEPVILPPVINSTLEYDLKLFFGKAGQFSRKRTRQKIDKKYQGSDILISARRMKRNEAQELAVYVDRSQSFSEGKTAGAESVFKKLTMMKNVSLRVFHFDTQVEEYDYMKNPDVVPEMGGNTSHEAVFNHIEENNFTNVAIITDYDSCEGKLPDCVKAIWFCIVCDGRCLMSHQYCTDTFTPSILKDQPVNLLNGRLFSVWLNRIQPVSGWKDGDDILQKYTSEVRRIFRGTPKNHLTLHLAFYNDAVKNGL